MSSPSRFTLLAQARSWCILLDFDPTWFSWTFSITDSIGNLKSSGDKAFPSLKFLCWLRIFLGKNIILFERDIYNCWCVSAHRCMLSSAWCTPWWRHAVPSAPLSHCSQIQILFTRIWLQAQFCILPTVFVPVPLVVSSVWKLGNMLACLQCKEDSSF